MTNILSIALIITLIILIKNEKFIIFIPNKIFSFQFLVLFLVSRSYSARIMINLMLYSELVTVKFSCLIPNTFSMNWNKLPFHSLNNWINIKFVLLSPSGLVLYEGFMAFYYLIFRKRELGSWRNHFKFIIQAERLQKTHYPCDLRLNFL